MQVGKGIIRKPNGLGSKISLVMAYNNTTSHYPATQLRIHRNIYSLLIAVFGSMP